MSLAKNTVDHPVLIFITFVMLGVIGLFTLGGLAIDLYPDVDFPMIIVLTTYENAGPESVEKSVTQTLESGLVSVSGLEKMTSKSSEGRSQVMLEFKYGTDLDVATNEVRDKIDRVKRLLPDAVDNPSIFKMDASAMPIMRIAVRGNRSADDLKQIADDYVKDRLEQTAGVAEASVSGGREQIVRVEVAQNRIDAYNLTLTGVAQSLSVQNLELGGGKITDSSKNYLIRTTGEFTDIDQIANTVVGVKNGYTIKLTDIANVYMGYEDEESAVFINGSSGVYVQITKQSGANTVKVADSVYKKIEEIQKTLPVDVTLEIVSDDTNQIRDTISLLLESAWQGIVLAMLILFLFLRSMKSTIIIGVSVPVSIVITLICMNFSGISLNMMTMTGLILGLGMVVDASIVILENIYSYRSRGAKPKIAAMLGSKEVFVSVFSGNMTTLCVFLPFIFFKKDLGFIGQLFQDMIFTVCIALASSLFVAVLLVPVLAGYFLPLTNRNEKPITNPVFKKFDTIGQWGMDSITNVFERALRWTLKNRLVTTLIVVGLLLGSAILAGFQLKFNMMPQTNDDSVTLNAEFPLGTTLDDTKTLLYQLSDILEQEVKGYDTLIVSAGSGGGFSSKATNKGSITIQLPSADKQIDTSETIKTKMRSHFGEFPSATFNFTQGMRGQISGSDIDIVVRSDDLDAALAVSKSIQDVMKTVDNLSESTIDMTDGLPQIEIVVDRDRAYSFGVSVSAVANEINACIDGKTATIYRAGGKEYDIVVMYRPEDRMETIDLENIFVSGNSGRVAVANFAHVTKGVGPVDIRRENQTRIVHVTADILNDASISEVEKDINNAIAASMVIPDAVSFTHEGASKETKEQAITYALIGILAILLVFGVMAGTYESFKDPFINLLTIPLLIIGVILIHVFTGKAMSMTSMIGVIMLVGVVVNNGIILVDYTNLLVDRGISVKDACLQAGVSRLRPVLMTTFTTIFGMLPLCFATDGSAAMIAPIGMTVVGGLISSTFITLLFVPVVYSFMNRGKNIKNSYKQEKNSLEVQV